MRTPEQRRIVQKKWYYKNRRKYLDTLKIWRDKNKDKVRMMNLRWRERHHDDYLKRPQDFKKSVKGIYSIIKHNSKKRGIVFDLAREDFINWYQKQILQCGYCETTDPTMTGFNKRIKRFTIDRKNNLLGYSLDNITLCCSRCNTVKGAVFTYEEMKEIGLKYLKNKDH